MKRARHMMTLLVSAWVTTGCSGSLIAKHTSDGLVSASYPLSLVYANTVERRVVGAGWDLDNVRADDSGTDSLISKSGQDWEFDAEFDTDRDGAADSGATQRLRRFELQYTHRNSGARLSLSVLPMPPSAAATDMDVLVRNYVDQVSGAGTVTVNLQRGYRGIVTAITIDGGNHFATKLLDSAVFLVAGQPAAGATFDLANVDQLQLADQSATQRARVVLIRAPFWLYSDGAWAPALVRVLYSTRPERFDGDAAELSRLVNAIRFADDEQKFVERHEALFDCVSPTVISNGELPLAYVVDQTGQLGRIWNDRNHKIGRCPLRPTFGEATFAPRAVAGPLGMIVREDGVPASHIGAPAGTPPFDPSRWPPATTTSPQ